MKEETINLQVNHSWVNDDFSPVDHTEEAEKVLADLNDFLMTPMGRKITAKLRRKMHGFTVDSCYKPDGTSYVNILGTYTCGTSVANKEDTMKVAQRLKGEELYAEAIVDGFNQAANDLKFEHRDDDDYQDFEQACLAIEADSLGKKGPFDGGGKDVAIKVSNACLESCADAKEPYEGFSEQYLNFAKRRISEYKEFITAEFSYEPEQYVERMRSKHLKSTMRAWPFFKAGTEIIKEEEFEAFKWSMSSPTIEPKIVKIALPIEFKDWLVDHEVIQETKEGKKTIIKKESPTVDEFLQQVMINLHKAGIQMSQWFNLRWAIIVPISRDQGSPFKTEYRGGKYVITKRGDRKYRIVTPIPSLVQSTLIMSTIDLVESAVKTTGRIGLQSPDINARRTKQFILDAMEAGQVLISSDYSTYDQKLAAWLMQATGSMYSSMYSNDYIKDALLMSGVAASQKLLFLPVDKSEVGKPYAKFTRRYFNQIKGDKSYARRLTLKGLRDPKRRKELQDLIDYDYDWMCCCFYIYKSYLPSGLILTNTLGSDCTLAMGESLVPQLFASHLKPKLVDRGVPDEVISKYAAAVIRAVASGDDLVMGVLRELYDILGYQGVLELFEESFAYLNMIVNAKKQIKIKYKGLPLYDFLQNVYPQGEKEAIEDYLDEPYLKFCRQAPNMPYVERFKKLYLVLQWCIVYGKLESCLCKKNIPLASKVMSYAGLRLNDLCQRTKYKPLVPISMWADRSKLYWSNQYIPLVSKYAGYEQFIGLVKNYGQAFLPELVKYSLTRSDVEVEDLVETFEQELETRAPHREELARILFSALDDETRKKVGADYYGTKPGASTHISLIPNLIQEWERTTGVVVNSVKLDKPKIGTEVQDQYIPGTEEDDAEGLDGISNE